MGWKIGGIFMAVLAVLMAAVTLTTAPEYRAGIEWVIVLLFAGMAFLFFMRSGKVKKVKKAAQVEKSFLNDEELAQIQAGALPVISGTPVPLAEGETAHFFAPARRYITKTKAVGRTGSGGGVSVRVAKGVTVRSGGGASQTIYDDVTDVFPGQVVVTDRRIVFMATQNGFEVKLASISGVAAEGGRLMIQAGAKSYRLAAADHGAFVAVVSQLVGQ